MKPIAAIAAAVAAGFLCTSAAAETADERNACFGDAFRVCWRDIPDRQAVYFCLWNNRDRLSENCRTVMNRHPPEPASHRNTGQSRRAD